MNKKVTKRLLSLVLSFVMVLSCVPATAFAVSAADSETIDVALYATPTADYTASWENLGGINNEAFEPTSSNMGAGKGWGNWSQTVGSIHWIQYDWDEAITTDTMQVYWYDDGGGTQRPSAVQFQYKDEDGEWKDLAMTSSLDTVLNLNAYNTIKVETVTTKAIRFNQTVREGAAANGVYRWKVMAPLTDAMAKTAVAYAKEKLMVTTRMPADTQLTSVMANGVSVTWSADHKAIKIVDGKAVVTRGETDVAGTLTATLSLNGITETKKFDVTVPAAMEAISDMLAKYDFSEMSGTLTAGTVISDTSGHDNNAVVYGTGIKAEDSALVLPGGDAYVELPKGMFDKQDNLTISMWIKNNNGANWTSAFFFGKNTTGYFMINPQNPSTSAAKMCITWGGSSAEIGLAPGSDLNAGPYTGSAWTHYIAVITPTSMTGYINGEKYGTYSLTQTISAMGDDLLSYIGKSTYGDPYFVGEVKSVSIYSKAMTDVEAGGLYTEGLTAQQVLDNAAKALDVPEIKDNVLSTLLYNTVTLKDAMLSGLVSIEWKSSNEALINTNTGKVSVPEKDTEVTLTATLQVGELTKQVIYDVLVLAEDSTSYSITMNVGDTGVDISQQLFGLFYEDINSAADGGLATELIKNNSFENYADVATPSDEAGRGDQNSWKQSWTSSNSSNFVVEQDAGLNENNTNYAKLTGNMTLSNNGFAARNNLNACAISITEGTKYDFSMYMKAESSYSGKITAKVVNSSGTALTDEQTLNLKKDGTWQKIEAVFTGSKTALGKLVLTISDAAVSDVIYIDMVSLNSQDTYGYGNKNYAYGAGLRKDLVETLAALKPSFIRFPGGCVIEGDMGTDGYYDWENSVGPLEERKATANYWSKHELNDYVEDYGYMMSYEFGYHEILTLCEDLGAEAFPILSAGIFCQFRNSADPIQVGDERLDEFADKGVHLLDYCWGDPDSDDEQEAYWAGLRVQNGHEEPFDLKYMGIGNENWNEGKVNYYANFKYMKDYIESYAKEHYPERSLTIISSTGPYAEGAAMTNAWNWVDSEMPGETLVDEHYYVGISWMLQNTHRYDSYDRLEDGGSNVFVGEYATNSSINTLEAAVTEAAYMTGFERNGDIVRHVSYAPLLCRLGSNNWSPNMIYFDEDEVMCSANYYTQLMYSNNYGKTLLNTDLSKMANTGSYYALADTQTDIYQVSSMNDDFIYLKLVNYDDYAKDITLNYPGIDHADAEIICLTGEADAVNSLGNEIIVPVSERAEVENEKLVYKIPAMSFTVVKVAIGDVEIDVTVNKTKLEDAVKNAVSADRKSDYTEDSWKIYETALETAKRVLADQKATQTEINDAVSALKAAQSGLKRTEKTGNIALYATTGASYNTSWNKGDAAVNDGENQIPDSDDYASVANQYTWGTWGNTSASETITYTWEKPVIIQSSDLYIWTDEGGIHAPVSYTYEYLPEENAKWQVLKIVDTGITASRTGALNSVAFDEPVTAIALRCILEKDAEDSNGIGLVEWEVYGSFIPYTDTASEDWFYNAVAYTYYNKLMTGLDETHFGPYVQLSRAQFALILYRMAGEPEVKATRSEFKDVMGNEWYGKAVIWAAEAGVVGGYEDGSFGPADLITREQMAVMMFRYAKSQNMDVTNNGDYSSYADAATVSPFAAEAMKWAVAKGIITGKDNGTKLDPQGITARAETAVIIQRFMEN